MSEIYRILHFGDIHFSERDDWDSSKVLTSFREFIPAIQDKIGRIDIACCTGDVAFSGSDSEFDRMSDWFQETFFDEGALKLTRDQMLIVPGNHDVSRSVLNSAAILIQDSIKKKEYTA